MPDLMQSLMVVLLFISGGGILLVTSRRLMTGLLALQYIGVFLLVSVSWPLEIAVVKLVAGWMASAVLFLTYQNLAGLNSENQIDCHSAGDNFQGICGYTGWTFCLFAGAACPALVPGRDLPTGIRRSVAAWAWVAPVDIFQG